METDNENYTRLYKAIFTRALHDARCNKRELAEEAKSWLCSGCGEAYCDYFGYNHSQLVEWINNGCPVKNI